MLCIKNVLFTILFINKSISDMTARYELLQCIFCQKLFSAFWTHLGLFFFFFKINRYFCSVMK